MQVWAPGSSCAKYKATRFTDSVSSYITVYLLFDGCDCFISQEQEEGNILWKTIGVKRAGQVFMDRHSIFRNSCNWERDRQDVKEVVGKDSII